MYTVITKVVQLTDINRFLYRAKAMLHGHVYVSIDHDSDAYKVNYVKLRQIEKSYKKAA